MIELSLLLSLGFISGIAAGLLGIGGGIIMVPGLMFISALQDPTKIISIHAAIATSLGTIIFTSISSARGHHLKNGVNYVVFRNLIMGLALGALIGSAIASSMSQQLLKQIVVIFLLIAGSRLFLETKNYQLSSNLKFINLSIHGTWIGTLSSILGIGGGTFIVPLLNAKGIAIRESIGTSAMCGIPIGIFGCFGFMALSKSGLSVENVIWSSSLIMAISSILGARYGVKLVYRIDQDSLKKLFGAFICIAAILLLIR